MIPRTRGIIRCKLIYNQIFKLAIALWSCVDRVTHLSPFFPRSCMSWICYIRGAGKKAKFCGAITESSFGGPGGKKSKFFAR